MQIILIESKIIDDLVVIDTFVTWAASCDFSPFKYVKLLIRRSTVTVCVFAWLLGMSRDLIDSVL